MGKIVMSGLVAAAAVLGCAGPAFAGTGTTGTAGTVIATSGSKTTVPASGQAAAAKSVAARIVSSYLGRLSATRPQASGGGFVASTLSGISCASPTACLSVGESMDTSAGSISGGITPIAKWLHAGTWKTAAVKAPKGVELTGVSCKAATYCLAAGEYLSNSAKGSISPYAMTWDGTTLTPIAAPPVPKADLLATLNSVSCVAVKSCVAFGTGVNGTTGDFDQLVWTLSGTKWTLSAVPSPENKETEEFTGLQCLSLKSCVAIGDSIIMKGDDAFDTTLAVSWNGATFTDLKAPVPAGVSDGEFSGLSCFSLHSCAVVGTGYTNSKATDSLGFADVWNGKTWTVTKWTGPKGDTQAGLLGVSCPSAIRCIAVGDHGSDKAGTPAALAWGGTKWTVLKVPGPGKGKAAEFDGISCPVNGQCVSIGGVGNAPVGLPTEIAGYWNGRTWRYGPM